MHQGSFGLHNISDLELISESVYNDPVLNDDIIQKTPDCFLKSFFIDLGKLKFTMVVRF